LDLDDSLCLKAVTFCQFRTCLGLKNGQQSPHLKEILMSLLHFAGYSIKEAIKLASLHFGMILDRLTTFENVQSFKVLDEYLLFEQQRLKEEQRKLKR
jgi:hypothetical protein